MASQCRRREGESQTSDYSEIQNSARGDRGGGGGGGEGCERGERVEESNDSATNQSLLPLSYSRYHCSITILLDVSLLPQPIGSPIHDGSQLNQAYFCFERWSFFLLHKQKDVSAHWWNDENRRTDGQGGRVGVESPLRLRRRPRPWE